MSGQTTPHLDLPLIASAQAQKHVTHNEAIWALDAVVHLAVPRSSDDDPPASPADGARHIVGPAPTGAWAGHAGEVAVRRDAAWLFLAPKAGWRAWCEADATLLVHDGTTWVAQTAGGSGGGGTIDRLPQLGIGADADATNVLAVAGPATLLSHAGDGHRLTVNKSAASQTASLLFQSAWSGRAEMGLAGQDDFSIKVSADGSSWNEAIRCDRATGAVTFPGGLAGTGSAAGALGGQVVAIVGERKALSSGTMAYGNGVTASVGPTMPFPGEILALTVSAICGSGGTATFAPLIDGTVRTAGAVTLTGSQRSTVVGDYRAAPIAFAAGAVLNVDVSGVNNTSNAVATLFVRLD